MVAQRRPLARTVPFSPDLRPRCPIAGTKRAERLRVQRSRPAVDGWEVTIAEHLIASTRGRDRSLLTPDRAQWLWNRLRETIGAAVLSLVLMPDHLHMMALPGQQQRLTRVLAMFTARTGVRFDIMVERANTAAIAGRMIRYGLWNPVEEGLVGDPWAWRWSTIRDLGGAAHPCWTPLDRVAALLQMSPAAALRKLTTVANRTALAPIVRTQSVASIDGVRSAVAAALRVPEAEVASRPLGRRLMVQACDAVAGATARRLASALDCGVRSVFRLRAPLHPALPAVMLCLTDARLRSG